MIQVVMYSDFPGETQCIRQLLSAFSIQHSWAECVVKEVTDCSQLGHIQGQVDIIISAVSDDGALDYLKNKKAQFPSVSIYPIAGQDVLPTRYVCPEIMPCGLFWRPLSKESAQPVVDQMMARLHDQTIPQSQNVFRISGKQKIQDIPYSSILYFEARDKKLVLRMKQEELVFSGTLSQLEEELPQEFIRCHKSILVNRRHILSVDRSNGLLVLDNHTELPISRGCKKAVLEVFQDGI